MGRFKEANRVLQSHLQLNDLRSALVGLLFLSRGAGRAEHAFRNRPWAPQGEKESAEEIEVNQ